MSTPGRDERLWGVVLGQTPQMQICAIGARLLYGIRRARDLIMECRELGRLRGKVGRVLSLFPSVWGSSSQEPPGPDRRGAMITRQLELGFASQASIRPLRRNGGRSGRANWWFEHMREVVDQARDWPPAVAPPVTPRPVPPNPRSEPVSRETASPADNSAPAASSPSAPSSAKPYRWQFGRTRGLIWE